MNEQLNEQIKDLFKGFPVNPTLKLFELVVAKKFSMEPEEAREAIERTGLREFGPFIKINKRIEKNSAKALQEVREHVASLHADFADPAESLTLLMLMTDKDPGDQVARSKVSTRLSNWKRLFCPEKIDQTMSARGRSGQKNRWRAKKTENVTDVVSEGVGVDDVLQVNIKRSIFLQLLNEALRNSKSIDMVEGNAENLTFVVKK